jgi:hypothetical protein
MVLLDGPITTITQAPELDFVLQDAAIQNIAAPVETEQDNSLAARVASAHADTLRMYPNGIKSPYDKVSDLWSAQLFADICNTTMEAVKAGRREDIEYLHPYIGAAVTAAAMLHSQFPRPSQAVVMGVEAYRKTAERRDAAHAAGIAIFHYFPEPYAKRSREDMLVEKQPHKVQSSSIAAA